MRVAEPPAPASSPAARLSRMAGLVLALTVAAMVLVAPAGAPARGAIARRGACPAATKHAKHTLKAGHCTTRRSNRHAKPVSRQPAKHPRAVKKGTHRAPSVAAQTPALCEDASAPVRSGGEFGCQDGSEPSCEDGSEPTAAAGSGAPVCLLASAPGGESPAEGCNLEAGVECQPGEWTCEESFGANEAPAACERTGEGEAVS